VNRIIFLDSNIQQILILLNCRPFFYADSNYNEMIYGDSNYILLYLLLTLILMQYS